MKTLSDTILEAKRYKYQIYLSNSELSISVVCLGHDNPNFDEDATYADINQAVKAIYKVDPICDIEIIPCDKLTKYVLNNFK